MAIDFGYVPRTDLLVHLTADADFIQSLTTTDGSDFPAGTAISIVFGDTATTTWAADVSGPSASWNVDKATVNSFQVANAGQAPTAKLTYTDSAGVDLTLMSGRVRWHA